MITPQSVVVASSRQVSCPLSEGRALLQLERGTYHGLDEVGARIWDLIATPRTVAAVVDVIADEYDVERDRCEGDLVRLLEEMAAQGLIEVEESGSR